MGQRVGVGACGWPHRMRLGADPHVLWQHRIALWRRMCARGEARAELRCRGSELVASCLGTAKPELTLNPRQPDGPFLLLGASLFV